MATKKAVRDVLKKYEKKLAESSEFYEFEPSREAFSREYEIFREEALSNKITFYERICNKAEKIIKIKVKPEIRKELDDSIEIAHLNLTPEGASSFSVLFAIIISLLGVIILLASFIKIKLPFILLGIFLILIAVLLIKPLSKYPLRLANRWRLEAGNQMVPCILYMVMYMRHTSNLEHAIKFAGEHISYPLSLDLRKIFWDVETGKYFSIKESLDHYLESWRKWNIEFIEAFHLIESSLYEPDEKRRVDLLEKSLEVMLEGTYERMMRYSRDVTNPITMLYYLGVILPILGLMIFPLVGAIMGGAVKWWYLALVYNIILPLFVLIFGNDLLAKRPTGYGESEILNLHPEYQKYQYILLGRNKVPISPMFVAVFVSLIIILIGLTPLIIHYSNPEFDLNFLGGKFLDYKTINATKVVGPFGLGALILSLFVPLGLAVGFIIYYRLKTRKLIEIRRETEKLEKEFSGALFQLGNRIADGIPSEIAFSKVADNMKGTPTGDFLRLVDINLRKLGMSLREAIFNEKRGAILYFPSTLIEGSMKVLVESAKKGSQIVAKSLITISIYFNRIRSVAERLKDLLAEIITSMKSQISFMTPMIAGIVVGVGSMITTVINKLGEAFAGMSTTDVTEFGNIGQFVNIFKIEEVIPSYQFQLIVGIYVVEITIILTILANGIENGIDKINEKYSISKNLFLSTTLYFIICLVGILIFYGLANLVQVITVPPVT